MAEQPCWILTNTDGERFDEAEDGVRHFPTEKIAVDYAEILADAWKPRQLDKLCITVTCICCDVTYDEEEEGTAHFVDIHEAKKVLADFWSFDGGIAECEACKAHSCDPERGKHG